MRFTLVLSTLWAAAGINGLAVPEVVDLTERAYTDSTDPAWTNDNQFYQALVARHNDYRKVHGVGTVAWNKTLSAFAKKYLDKKGSGQYTCPDFAHSGGPYGENLALGYGSPKESVTAWGEERQDYDFKKPGFSSETGHFTQVVWKSTTTIGCARKWCTASGIKGWYLVCEYWPRGNVIGQFDTQVKQGTYKPAKRSLARDEEERDVGDQEYDGHVGESVFFQSQ